MSGFVLPCEECCPSCGKKKVSRKFLEPGDSILMGKSSDASDFDTRLVVVENRELMAERNCIVHSCLSCGKEWVGDTWARRMMWEERNPS